MKNLQSTPQSTDIINQLEDKMFVTSPLIFPLVALAFLFLPCFIFCLCYARGFKQLPPKTPKTPKQIA
ncbi:hypothetical protein [endosymbiont DhMRE of Dentiscutata heterogama]|uniref:hypothetical protein n=1 Tax=endosymbiont DhMRE of Dentiscutata heterogama TaxID=1609546 RepID=UPI002AD1E0C9|nr:hypothetical protein [endosymbiont DhMRE of Dentiscutata heterogama]